VTRIGAFDTVEQEVDLGARRVRIVRPRSPEDLPYWAQLWPSSLALARQLTARDLTGIRAVELGCGLGLCAAVAALAGADVVATDVDADAVAFARTNGRRLLGRRLATMRADFLEPPAALEALAPFDLAIAADVLYTAGLVAGLAVALDALVRPGGEVIVAYPWTGQADALVATLGWPAQDRPVDGVRLLWLSRPAAAIARPG
jgi:predicted nicotinamide N-methyase